MDVCWAKVFVVRSLYPYDEKNNEISMKFHGKTSIFSSLEQTRSDSDSLLVGIFHASDKENFIDIRLIEIYDCANEKIFTIRDILVQVRVTCRHLINI